MCGADIVPAGPMWSLAELSRPPVVWDRPERVAVTVVRIGVIFIQTPAPEQLKPGDLAE